MLCHCYSSLFAIHHQSQYLPGKLLNSVCQCLPKKMLYYADPEAHLCLGYYINLLWQPGLRQGVGQRVQRGPLPIPKHNQVNVAARAGMQRLCAWPSRVSATHGKISPTQHCTTTRQQQGHAAHLLAVYSFVLKLPNTLTCREQGAKSV
jgi:hypothetical protein